ncbi:hypothetical protein CLV84_0753 [Neolewinella xylanilytica]|uniref:Adhesin domain-containing protein n=1 Tax=Neolewinella xylanilytica TaxID=1514080 RepID=A0A2S6I8H5_9BACT|nr:DUF4097 family beta strand repeat-containing protein [Neolewinella xylanilytica]PPK87800.1 hypothetical protein CLV84_0753 [Neolewinella xylanilytica]
MLRILLSSLLLAAGHLSAQSDPRIIPTNGATHLDITANFGDVELVPSHTDQLTLRHVVVINGVERPELGEITVDRRGDRLIVAETSPTEDQLSRECAAQRASGGNGRQYNCNSRIELQIAVPAGMQVEVDTKYGGVHVADIAGLTRVHSTYGTVEVDHRDLSGSAELDLYSNYGEVDLTLPANATAELELITEFGTLLTDFDIAIDAEASEQRQFYERVVGTIGQGGGAQVRCRSPYDTVYLRRAK